MYTFVRTLQILLFQYIVLSMKIGKLVNLITIFGLLKQLYLVLIKKYLNSRT